MHVLDGVSLCFALRLCMCQVEHDAMERPETAPTRNPWRYDRFPHSKVEKVPQAAGITIKSVYGSLLTLESI